MSNPKTYFTADGRPVVDEGPTPDALVDTFVEAMRARGEQVVIVYGRPESCESLSAFGCPRCSAPLDAGHLSRLSAWGAGHLQRNVAAIARAGSAAT